MPVPPVPNDAVARCRHRVEEEEAVPYGCSPSPHQGSATLDLKSTTKSPNPVETLKLTQEQSEDVLFKQENDLGMASMGILYLSFTLVSLVASPMVRVLGSKNALVLGTTSYWLFIASNLKPSWFVTTTLIPICVITGNGSSAYSYLGPPWGPFGRVLYAHLDGSFH